LRCYGARGAPPRRPPTAQVLFRHGARTATKADPPFFASRGNWSGCLWDYPGAAVDLIDEAGPGPPPKREDERKPAAPGDGSCLLGWLTPQGFEQARALGAYLRRRYGGGGGGGAAAKAAALLPAAWEPRLLWAHSTRCARGH
jgi:hypothetical protein